MKTRAYGSIQRKILLIGWVLVVALSFSCAAMAATATPTAVPTDTPASAPSLTPTPAAAGQPTQEATPVLGAHEVWRKSRIAFASNRSGSFQVYLMNPDGSGLVQLTDSVGDNRSPAWSWDGKKIFFVSTRDGNPEIYAMDPDGKHQQNLTRDDGQDFLPIAVPPDQVAFVSDRRGDQHIFLMNADGSGAHQFAHTGIASTERIICLVWFDERALFYTVEENSKRLTRILDTASGETWIPELLTGEPDRSCPLVSQLLNSDWVMFISNRDGHDEIYGFREKLEADTRFTEGSEPSLGLSRSMDQGWITYFSRRPGNWDIYVMGIVGKYEWNVTNDPADDVEPAWEPY